ncbi:MAG: hypothetical protein D6756_14050 [Cyanobacteria bacterium J083]|nr:MAG: hypothetical protein D6756_14050 [Cyanobacteria bacterium J083]
MSNSSLIIIAFATCFFARNIVSLGLPSVINFIHFATIPIVCLITLITTKVKNQTQIKTTKQLLFCLLFFLIVTLVSSLINQAGAINLVLNFLILAEPFMLLIAIISLPLTKEKLKQFQVWLSRFCLFHIFLAISQYYLLITGFLQRSDMTLADNVQGVFYWSNGGHVVGASVGTAFSLYYFVARKTSPLWLRASILVASVYHLLLADAKQVILVMFAAWFLLIITSLGDIRKTVLYLIAALIAVYLFVWCMQNVELFRHFNTWIRPGIYEPEGEATLLKTSSIRIIISYFQSPLNWLFGLGPGHTVGRLGGWMLGYRFGRYWELLEPLGATRLFISADVWAIYKDHWLNSSFFSPLFSWVGIWGNFGFLGLGAYVWLWVVVWHRVCSSDFSKYMILNVLIHGFILTQLEEPGYMLLIAFLIGIRWHELSLSKKTVLVSKCSNDQVKQVTSPP